MIEPIDIPTTNDYASAERMNGYRSFAEDAGPLYAVTAPREYVAQFRGRTFRATAISDHCVYGGMDTPAGWMTFPFYHEEVAAICPDCKHAGVCGCGGIS